MTGTDLCVNKPHLVPVIFEPPCSWFLLHRYIEMHGQQNVYINPYVFYFH